MGAPQIELTLRIFGLSLGLGWTGPGVVGGSRCPNLMWHGLALGSFAWWIGVPPKPGKYIWLMFSCQATCVCVFLAGQQKRFWVEGKGSQEMCVHLFWSALIWSDRLKTHEEVLFHQDVGQATPGTTLHHSPVHVKNSARTGHADSFRPFRVTRLTWQCVWSPGRTSKQHG